MGIDASFSDSCIGLITMTYSTVSAMLARFDAEEMAQRTDRSLPRIVSGDMLITLAAGNSMATYTTLEQAAAAASLNILQLALQDASDVINGFVQGRYPVPLVNPPNAILLAECDLARYYLYDDNTTEVIKTRYESAMSYLKSIRDGKTGNRPTL